LCKGGELFDLIKQKKKFDEPPASTIIKTLLSVIAYCHNEGVVHRDLKPRNILLDTNHLSIKVIDFGFATREKMMEDRVGTAEFVAPEVLMGEYTEKCDLWSVGIITYNLLMGKVPFIGGSYGDTC